MTPIGIDFGSTSLRAAYRGLDGRLRTLEADAREARWPVLLCESGDPTAPPSFPSVKARLGRVGAVLLESGTAPPAAPVVEGLRALIRAVEKERGGPVARAVVSVPARYGASQRAALREAALAAGLAEVQLVNDSLAAAVAQMSEGGERATLLAYGMGYSGYELGLVRAVKGRYRPLGYEGGERPDGASLDRALLRAVVSTLREPGLETRLEPWSPSFWLELRSAVAAAKEELSHQAQASLPPLFRHDGQRLGVLSFERSGLERAFGGELAATVAQALALLAGNGMEPAELDAVVLFGGSARIPLIAAEIERQLGRKPRLLGLDALARGAALLAAGPENELAAAPPEPERQAREVAGSPPREPAAPLWVALEPAPRTARDDPPSRLTLPGPAMGRGGVLAPLAELEPARVLAAARRLAEEGRTAEARTRLEELVAGARELLASLDREARESPGEASAGKARRETGVAPFAPVPAEKGQPARARGALNLARRLLREGQREDAVRQSHLAWQLDKNDPNVFEKMIEIHCQAAEAASGPEGFEHAVRWLGCAHQHDQSNRRIRQLLAERYHRQARSLAQAGQTGEARACLESCLAWDPDHPEALALQANLPRAEG